jgi:hypothetical protein
MTIGLDVSELESIILAHTDNILARGTSGSTLDNTEALLKATIVLAEATQRALRQVARAIVENNKRITKQLEESGIKIT